MINTKEQKIEWLTRWLLTNTQIVNPVIYGVSAMAMAEFIVNKMDEIDIAAFELKHEAALETRVGEVYGD